MPDNTTPFTIHCNNDFRCDDFLFIVFIIYFWSKIFGHLLVITFHRLRVKSSSRHLKKHEGTIYSHRSSILSNRICLVDIFKILRIKSVRLATRSNIQIILATLTDVLLNLKPLLCKNRKCDLSCFSSVIFA